MLWLIFIMLLSFSLRSMPRLNSSVPYNSCSLILRSCLGDHGCSNIFTWPWTLCHPLPTCNWRVSRRLQISSWIWLCWKFPCQLEEFKLILSQPGFLHPFDWLLCTFHIMDRIGASSFPNRNSFGRFMIYIWFESALLFVSLKFIVNCTLIFRFANLLDILA